MENEMRRLLELFTERGVKYQLFEHEPVYTSEQAAIARGVELRTGIKALLLKVAEGRFLLADVAADRRIDPSKVRRLTGASRISLASRDEVLSITRCEVGAVHPFGSLFGLPTYLDRSVLANESVNFNIGVLTRSVRISVEDLRRLVGSEPTDFSTEPA